MGYETTKNTFIEAFQAAKDLIHMFRDKGAIIASREYNEDITRRAIYSAFDIKRNEFWRILDKEPGGWEDTWFSDLTISVTESNIQRNAKRIENDPDFRISLQQSYRRMESAIDLKGEFEELINNDSINLSDERQANQILNDFADSLESFITSRRALRSEKNQQPRDFLKLDFEELKRNIEPRRETSIKSGSNLKEDIINKKEGPIKRISKIDSLTTNIQKSAKDSVEPSTKPKDLKHKKDAEKKEEIK